MQYCHVIFFTSICSLITVLAIELGVVAVGRWCWVTFSPGAFNVGQEIILLAVGAGGVVWLFFSLAYHIIFFSLSLKDGSVT